MNLCIVNEDHPWFNGPRRAIQACPGRGWAFSGALSGPLALSHLESGHAVPCSPQGFCSPCAFVYCSHNTGSCWPGSASLYPTLCLASGRSPQTHWGINKWSLKLQIRLREWKWLAQGCISRKQQRWGWRPLASLFLLKWVASSEQVREAPYQGQLPSESNR